jgi:hypothetical protein
VAVAASSTATVCDHDTVTVGDEVGQDLTGLLVVNHGAYGKFDGDGFAAASTAMGRAAVPAVFRLVMFPIAQIEQRRQSM